ncbi:rRNA maturation RNase YbeY [Daejeonella lutea]|uniref:Endoribonuclease YbeY n=1 Tax=Daejeonella lutea TaxID=572036 RepID=A0A1T5DM41_9SPHI|nr:rRNA maturation RNase YbeY [Daejeonella lutea]SKB72766.1 rRNA maturation RNase YbeY [Daejeonella lutea]
MPQLPINFFVEDISFNLKQRIPIRKWIKHCINTEGFRLKELNFIFCSDAYLLVINRDYLNHNTLTDIITFDNSEVDREIVGDIFISIDRVNENAVKFKVPQKDELHRVIIHGTLHLLGYPDKGKAAKTLMTSKEDYYLAHREF